MSKSNIFLRLILKNCRKRDFESTKKWNSSRRERRSSKSNMMTTILISWIRRQVLHVLLVKSRELLMVESIHDFGCYGSTLTLWARKNLNKLHFIAGNASHFNCALVKLILLSRTDIRWTTSSSSLSITSEL